MMRDDTPGDRLRQARQAAGVARPHLAGKLGVAQSTIRAHETGQNGINPAAAERYAAELGVDPSWLLYGQGSAVPRVGLVKRTSVPIVGIVEAGFHDPAHLAEIFEEMRGNLTVSVPGYSGAGLEAYLNGASDARGYTRYVIALKWSGQSIRIVDEVILRVSKEDLIEVDVWKVGGDPDWIVFYKGESQAAAWIIHKVRRATEVADVALPKHLQLVGIVVARFEYREWVSATEFRPSS